MVKLLEIYRSTLHSVSTYCILVRAEWLNGRKRLALLIALVHHNLGSLYEPDWNTYGEAI